VGAGSDLSSELSLSLELSPLVWLTAATDGAISILYRYVFLNLQLQNVLTQVDDTKLKSHWMNKTTPIRNLVYIYGSKKILSDLKKSKFCRGVNGKSVLWLSESRSGKTKNINCIFWFLKQKGLFLYSMPTV